VCILNLYSSWQPDHPPSKGATAYHDAVANTSWHKKNINELIKIIRRNIKDTDTVIDFGAGTGSSTIYFLNKFPKNTKLILVDNSPSWLGKAYEILHKNNNVTFALLEKKDNRIMTLDEITGINTIDHVISANTVHLIPNISDTFNGIYKTLKTGGTFTFQSGNIIKMSRKRDILMIDDSLNLLHDIALEMIRTDKKFAKYKTNLNIRIEQEKPQRKFVFPTPRPIDFYLEALRSAGFKNEISSHAKIKVAYKDWMNFLRVRRLQAGILPEIGGKDATLQEEKDRDLLITKAARSLFKKLKMENKLANTTSFVAEWIYVQAKK
jgi:ubiquinone/menaquinone biosynthesis C-methylase UbiE